MTTATQLLRVYDETDREANRISIASTSTHNLRVAFQNLDTPAMCHQFCKEHRDQMRADINSELAKRGQLLDAFQSMFDHQLGEIQRANKNVAPRKTSWRNIPVYPGTLVLLATEELHRRVSALRKSPQSWLTDFDAEILPTSFRPRFKSNLARRNLGHIEDSVPVEQYGTDEYE